MFTFTPLLGAQSPSSASQSLLEFDGGVKILVDVGWDESFDAEKLKKLERQVPTISVVLLTHATIAHIGAFAHCCKHVPLFNRIPVYATSPVIALGRALLQDLYASTPLASSVIPSSLLSENAYSTRSSEKPSILLQPPTTDEIADFFREIHPLKYSQAHQPLSSPFLPPLEGLTITAYCAGHTLGGTIWLIQHGSESVVYAVDWNQARENVLSGAAWLSSGGGTGAEVIEELSKPTALICSSRGAESTAITGGWKRRDELLLDQIRPVVESGGTVLIPCDSSARVLELSYVLDHAWRSENAGDVKTSLQKARLYLAGRTYGATMQNTKRMLEWMNESIVREFEAAASSRDTQNSGASHPFEFKHLKVLERQSQITRALESPGPKVFLASDTSLQWGFSKDIVRHIAGGPDNLVILTNSNHPPSSDKNSNGTLYESLLGVWEKHNASSSGHAVDDSKPATISCNGRPAESLEFHTSPLVGNDLSLYQQYLAGLRQRQNTTNTDKASKLEASADAADEASSSSSSSSSGESDAEHQGKALNASATLNYSKNKLGLKDDELGVNILIRRKGVHDYEVRGKKGRERMFPYVGKRRRVDEFGDLIRPEDYLRAEERDDTGVDATKGEGAVKDTSLGQKRRWNDQAAERNDLGRRLSTGNDKRLKAQGGRSADHGKARTNGGMEVDEDGSDESDYEPAEPTIQGPTRLTFTAEVVKLNLKVTLVDFSGVHDKRSLQMLIPLIKPRKLILTAGNKEETLSLAEDCRKLFKAASFDNDVADILLPTVGMTVDASVDTNAWTIKLSQSMVTGLHWQNVRGLGVVTVTGRVKPPDAEPETEESSAKKQKMLSDAELKLVTKDAGGPDVQTATPILDVLPPNIAAATRTVSQPLQVGDLRLADLRKLMQATGHTADFKGEGTLLVDGLIIVRKSGVGKIEVESGGILLPGSSAAQLSGSFHHVKRKIYESLAVVTAR